MGLTPQRAAKDASLLHAVGVVAGGDEQGGGAVGSDAVALQQLRGVGVEHGGDVAL